MNGAGKTTLLKLINELLTPTSGEILLEGNDIVDDISHLETRRKIGMVFQQFNLFNHLTVLENITLSPVLASSLKIICPLCSPPKI